MHTDISIGDYYRSQPALLEPITHNPTLPAPVCHAQQTPTQMELVFYFVPVLQDSSELLRRMQVLAVPVSGWVDVRTLNTLRNYKQCL